jgi:integrase
MARKRAYGAQWSVQGGGWVFHRPLFIKGAWRCRKRRISDGEIKQVTLVDATGFDSAKDEVQKLRKEAADLAGEEGDGGDLPQITVKDAVEKFITVQTAEGRWTGINVGRMEDRMRLIARTLGEERLIEQIDYNWMEVLFTTTWKDLSGATKRKLRGSLVRLFRWASKKRYIPKEKNPAADYQEPPAWRAEEKRANETTGQGLTVPEMKRLLSACPRGPLWDYIFIALRTPAIRQSNIFQMAWKWLDLRTGVISITDKEFKTRVHVRLPIHRELLTYLRNLRQRRDAADDDLVVGTIHNMDEAMSRVLVRAGLEDKETGLFLGKMRAGGEERPTDKPRRFRAHDLKHAASSLIGSIAPSYVCATLDAHKLQGVDVIYAKHLTEKTLRRWLDKTPSILQRKQDARGRPGNAVDGKVRER